MISYEALKTQLEEFGNSLTLIQRGELREIHDSIGFMCNAASEGLWCCVDFILGEHERLTD